jgi:uncharacterized Fe-S cluster protein YjdI/CDGSH-type Zn-finger protein
MATEQRSEERYAPTVERVYENADVEVTWEPRFCIHWAACIRGSSRAFNPRRKPWVDVNAESPERIAEIVARCPTGALHARFKDGRPAEVVPEAPAFLPTLDGPMFVRGRIRLLDRAGQVIREDTRVALCRCGHSQNKPFCDDSHYSAGFQSNDPHLGPEGDDPDAWPAAGR